MYFLIFFIKFSEFLFAACKLDSSQRESLKQFIVVGSENSSINFTTDLVKEKLSKIIPQVSQQNYLNNKSNNISKSNVSHTKSFQKGDISVPNKSEDSEEEIEFVTTVTADDKKQEKRKSEDFSFLDKFKKKLKTSDQSIDPIAKTQEFSDSINATSSENTGKKDVTDEKVKDATEESPTIAQASTGDTTKKPKSKEKIPCKYCKNSFKNKTGLFIHMGRVHRNEAQSNQNDSNPKKSEAGISNLVIQDVFSEASKSSEITTPTTESEKLDSTTTKTPSSTTKWASCRCGKRFADEKKVLSHQKRSCRYKQDEKGDSSLIEGTNNAKVVTDSLELEEKSSPSDDVEINRRLFMDNIKEPSDDEEEEDVEIVDFIAAKVSSPTDGESPSIKNEPVDSEQTLVSSNNDVASEENREPNEETKSPLELIKTESVYFKNYPRHFEVATEELLVEYMTTGKACKFLPGWTLKHNKIKKKSGEIVTATHFLSPAKVEMEMGLEGTGRKFIYLVISL